MKGNLRIAALVVFVCSSVFLLSSCARRQVVGEGREIMTFPEEEAVTVEEEEKPSAEEVAEQIAGEFEEEAELDKEEATEIETPEEVELAKRRQAEAEERRLREIAEKFPKDSVYFDFDKSSIKPEYRPVLVEIAQFLREHPSIRIKIEGNCDERGTDEYNLALGERRANSAKSFLVSLGIPPDRIEIISYGEERPLFRGQDEESWAKNRRDDFVIIRE